MEEEFLFTCIHHITEIGFPAIKEQLLHSVPIQHESAQQKNKIRHYKNIDTKEL